MDAEFHPALAAMLTGDLDALQALTKAQPELVLRRSSCGHPTLLQMVACEAHHLPAPLKAAEILVDAGAEMTGPLLAAASVDARQILRFLLDQGASVHGAGAWSPLDEAVYWRHLDLASELRTRGAKIDTLRVAAGLGKSDDVDRFFENGTLRTDAGPVRSQFADTVPAARADNSEDILNNAFVMAAQNGWIETTTNLLTKGACINAKPPGLHWRGTALHGAIWHGDTKMVAWLLKQGADPSIRDNLVGSDGIGWADHHGHKGIADLLRARSPA